MRIPKREYEAIKNRVTAIEKRISREFEFVQATKSSDLSSSSNHHGTSSTSGASSAVHQSEDVSMISPPGQIANVQDKYVRALEETEELTRSAGGTDELAKRLGRDLKIRRSVEHKIMRSPSARKIGSIRRRSSNNNNSKLNRTRSLNITQTRTTSSGRGEEEERVKREVLEDNEPVGLFYPRQTSNLKRGRPNTIQSGLRVHRSPPDGGRRAERTEEATMRRRSATLATLTKPIPPISAGPNEFYPAAPVAAHLEEVWTDAQDFFAEKQPPLNMLTVTPKRIEANERRGSLRSAGKTPTGLGSSPRFAMPNPEDNLLKTPMLPPKRAPRKTPGSSMAKNHYLTPLQQAQQTGRASIARIRSQNAGMVLAKARLFNDLVTDDEKAPPSAVALEVKRAMGMALQKENRETPKTFVTSFRKPQIKPVLLANSPRRLVKTPSRERATPVRALPRSPPRPQANRGAAVRQF